MLPNSFGDDSASRIVNSGRIPGAAMGFVGLRAGALRGVFISAIR
jgi:hypothetical protein